MGDPLAIDVVTLGGSVYFDHNAINGSGFSADYIETPKFWVFKDADTTGIAASLAGATLSFRTGFQGHYYGNFSASTGVGFVTGSYYNVMVSGLKKVSDNFTGSIFTQAHTFTVQTNNFDTLAAANSDVYFADISLDRDPVSYRDEWSTVWYKNGAPTSGYSLANLQVIKRDNTNLFNTAMTGVGTGYIAAKVDITSASQFTIDGESYICLATAYIDNVVRTGVKIISRDNLVG